MSAATPRVSALEPSDDGAWLDLVAGDPRASIYFTPWWRDFLAAATGATPHVLGAWRGGRLAGVLPMFVRDGEAGPVVNSQPWWGTHGGCHLAPGAGPEVRAALLRAAGECLDAWRAAGATFILTPDEEPHREVYARHLGARPLDRRTGQVTRLPCGAADPGEAVLRTARQKTRNLIRKALRQGFRLERAGDDEAAWRFLAAVHVEGIRAKGGRPKPWAHFAALRTHVPPDLRRLYVAHDGDEPVAALLLVHFNETVEYVTPAVRVEWRSRQPLSFLVHHAMCDAIAAGRPVWNWGGTWATQRSLHHFKRGWGATDHPYSYLVRAGDRLRRALRADPARLVEAYPFFYLYPFDQV